MALYDITTNSDTVLFTLYILKTAIMSKILSIVSHLRYNLIVVHWVCTKHDCFLNKAMVLKMNILSKISMKNNSECLSINCVLVWKANTLILKRNTYVRLTTKQHILLWNIKWFIK